MVSKIFLLSAAPAADTAVMSETKGVRQLVAKTELEKVKDLHIGNLFVRWIVGELLCHPISIYNEHICLRFVMIVDENLKYPRAHPFRTVPKVLPVDIPLK